MVVVVVVGVTLVTWFDHNILFINLIQNVSIRGNCPKPKLSIFCALHVSQNDLFFFGKKNVSRSPKKLKDSFRTLAGQVVLEYRSKQYLAYFDQ